MKRYLLISLFILMIPTIFSEGWLSGWGQRVSITFDHNDIDNNLINFPVLILISDSCGINDEDMTFIFDQIKDADKKMAFTLDNGTTEIYAEIEEWNNVSKIGCLWVKVNLSSSSDTLIYMYYASNQSDNNAYIGDIGSTPGRKVWDDNFKLVTHLIDDPDTSHISDSTIEDNDGTKKGANEPILTTSGKIDSAQHFDGSNDYIDIPDSFDSLSEGTIEFWFRADMVNIYHDLFASSDYTGGDEEILWTQIQNDNTMRWGVASGGSYLVQGTSTDSISATTWYYIVIIVDSSGNSMYWNNIQKTLDYSHGGPTSPFFFDDVSVDQQTYMDRLLWAGSYYSRGDGITDEFRISNISRNLEWIKGTYETERDNLIDYGAELTYDEWLGDEDEIVNWSVWTQFTLIGTIVYCGVFAILVGGLFTVIVGKIK